VVRNSHYFRDTKTWPEEAVMAHAAVIEKVTTITVKGQTTVPKPIRQALGVDAGDQIAFRLDASGVTIRRADAGHEDPAVAAFLSFLARDMKRHPGKLKALTPDLARQIAELVEGVEFDPDAPIEGDVDL
jgi:antitoxin PrlF